MAFGDFRRVLDEDNCQCFPGNNADGEHIYVKFDAIHKIVGDTPCLDSRSCRMLYDFILRSNIKDCLELGFAHGKSSCFIGGALHEKGQGGKLLTIDRSSVRSLTPNILEQIEKAELSDYIQPVFSETSYTWELMHLIEEATVSGHCIPRFDFVFIDGAHTWETDACAFFLVAKLLRPGGWILFDDLKWTLENSPSLSQDQHVKALPDDVRKTPHVERIVTLLVAQSPEFQDIVIRDGWAWVKKRATEIESNGSDIRIITKLYFLHAMKRALRNKLVAFLPFLFNSP